MSYDNTDRGAIWKNDDKQSDTHPDFKGNLNVGGVEYYVSAWKRKPDANEKAPALIFSVKRKDQAAEPARQAVQQASGGMPDDFDGGDIPFKQPHDEYFG